MILVDSSVWIDFFNGREKKHVEKLYELLGNSVVVTGDLILIEVLQGFRNDSQFQKAKEALESLPFFTLSNKELALKSAEDYRTLRNKGVTIRKTIDMIIATFCIQNKIRLLHADKDFVPMEKFLGLQVL
ncbi:type II toxin-antitoxin system VapC family toxin [Arthrospiribacter ruber]|uniref:PIN domain nuclease n=1 Tax=Arthrospiribacter ruber TaxID=2487934 RepID=A0A951IX20_9BACT|nr:PIN domain nuclease [Arthrospiribacter ruber]MBW3467887.1 PIN domain nuclease [Arthrospiribacter ruber]